jgi:hypothetical protein
MSNILSGICPELRSDAISLLSASLARGTWLRYRSGWNSFFKFQVETKTSYKWPLSVDALRNYTVFCLTKKNL